MRLFEFDKSTGRIICRRDYPTADKKTVDELLAVYPDSIYCPDGFIGDDVNYYVEDGNVVPRPAQPVYLVGMKLRGVRPGASVIIEGESYNVTDTSDIELEFSHPGKYEVQVIDWPYLDWSVQIEN